MNNHTMLVCRRLFELSNETGHSITPLKLQKLLYFIQGIGTIELNGELIIDNDFFAWDHGPVIPEVYHAYKKYRYFDINVENEINILTALIGAERQQILEDNIRRVIDIVWNSLGIYDGKKLEQISHTHDTWKNSYQKPNDIITGEAILNYFQSIS